MNQTAEAQSNFRTGPASLVSDPTILLACRGFSRPRPDLTDDRSLYGTPVVAGLLPKPGEDTSAGVLVLAGGAHQSQTSIFRDAAGNVLAFDLVDLVGIVIAVFRHHPHINNVLTHICGGRWERIGQAIRVILNPLATLNDLSPLARNIVELMCAERGITGRILKPYFHALLANALPPQTAAYLRTHVFGLLQEMQNQDTCSSWVAGGRGNKTS